MNPEKVGLDAQDSIPSSVNIPLTALGLDVAKPQLGRIFLAKTRDDGYLGPDRLFRTRRKGKDA